MRVRSRSPHEAEYHHQPQGGEGAGGPGNAAGESKQEQWVTGREVLEQKLFSLSKGGCWELSRETDNRAPGKPVGRAEATGSQGTPARARCSWSTTTCYSETTCRKTCRHWGQSAAYREQARRSRCRQESGGLKGVSAQARGAEAGWEKERD